MRYMVAKLLAKSLITITPSGRTTCLPEVNPVDTVASGADSAWRNIVEIRPFRGKRTGGKRTLVSASITQAHSDWLEALAVAAGLLPCASALHHAEEMTFRPMQAVSCTLWVSTVVRVFKPHLSTFGGFSSAMRPVDVDNPEYRQPLNPSGPCRR